MMPLNERIVVFEMLYNNGGFVVVFLPGFEFQMHVVTRSSSRVVQGCRKMADNHCSLIKPNPNPNQN